MRPGQLFLCVVFALTACSPGLDRGELSCDDAADLIDQCLFAGDNPGSDQCSQGSDAARRWESGECGGYDPDSAIDDLGKADRWGLRRGPGESCATLWGQWDALCNGDAGIHCVDKVCACTEASVCETQPVPVPQYTWSSDTDLELDGLLKWRPLTRCGKPDRSQAEELLCFFFQRGRFGAFDGVDGARIHHVAFRANPERAAIVLATGRNESFLKYSELVYDFMVLNADLGYSLYLFDHRGQGFSDRLLGAGDSQKGYVKRFDDYIADLKIFVREVVQKESHHKLFGFAHSMGGGILTRYAEIHTQDFQAIVLGSPMIEIPVSAAESVALRVLVHSGKGEEYARGKGPWNSNPIFDPTKASHSENRYNFTRYLPSVFGQLRLGGPTNRWVVEAYRATEKMRSKANRISIPVLLLQSELDDTVLPAGQVKVCVKARDCKLLVFSGGNHELYIEIDEIRNSYLDQMVNFFETQLAEE